MATGDKTYAVMVDDDNKLVFPTAEEIVSSNNLLPSNIVADSFIVGDPNNPDVKISELGVEVNYLGIESSTLLYYV